MENFSRLTTERLFLRELSTDDVADLFAIHANAEAMRWFGNDPMCNVSEAEQMIKKCENLWREGTGLRWAIERRSDGVFLGTCGLFKWNHGWRSCAIGYELAPFARGYGYMQEALCVAIAYGFESMQLNRIEAQVHTQNIASLKTLNALGFVQEGLGRQAGYWHNSYHDLYQLALINLDYQNSQQAKSRNDLVDSEIKS